MRTPSYPVSASATPEAIPHLRWQRKGGLKNHLVKKKFAFLECSHFIGIFALILKNYESSVNTNSYEENLLDDDDGRGVGHGMRAR